MLVNYPCKGESEKTMLDDTVYTLVPSSNRGRYACDDATYGHDLTSGESCAIQIGGQWITGHIEHSSMPTEKYPEADGCYTLTNAGLRMGYYFISDEGDICGLCVGMKVRVYR